MRARTFCFPAVCIAVIVFSALAQHSNDTLLFAIKLDGDTGTLLACSAGEPIRNSLSGPVLMENGNMLFYSRDGYALYDQKGTKLDSHSLARKNRWMKFSGRGELQLAYPLDPSTLLYYRTTGQKDAPAEFYQKKLFRPGLKQVSVNEFEVYSQIGSSQLFNLHHNGLTDEMAHKAFLVPQLVGYSSLTGGKRWWSVDKFYSFTSPLILEENGAFLSFFPGLKSSEQVEVRKSLIEPLGVFQMNGAWYYYGIYSPGGETQTDYFQKLFLCDQAGNLLYDNTILKNSMEDAVLAENEEEKMLYTVKRASRHVFLPAVDENGDIFYGVIDYNKKQIEVMKRLFYKFVPVPTGAAMTNEIFHQAGYAYDLNSTECGRGDGAPVLPKVLFADSAGGARVLTEKELTVKGYIVKLARIKDDDLQKKLQRVQPSLPPRVRQIQDSLARISTARCPYSLVLSSHKKGDLCTFDYNVGDVVVSARVLAVTNTFEVFVRVDLVNWAEIIVFSLDGQFLNRFVFNTEEQEVRNDVVAVSPERTIIEKDYEIGDGAYRYISWKLSTQLPRAQTARR
jgi:hypothetical protein